MDILNRFDRLRPDDEYLDDETRHRVWAKVSRTVPAEATAQGAVEVDRANHTQVVAIQPSEPTRRRFALVGAAAIIVIGLGGLAILQANRTVPDTPVEAIDQTSVTVEQPALIGLTAPSLPNGLALLPSQSPPAVRSEPSGFQVRLFGAKDDPQDPTRMIRVEYAVSRAMAIPCHSFVSLSMPDAAIEYSSDEWTGAATPMAGSTPFTVAATTGSYCVQPNGPLQAGWFTGDIGVSLLAGTSVTPAELVEFAQSLKSVAPVEQLSGRPDVDLVADPLPAGLTVLVGEDVPFTQQITETSWVATVGGVDGGIGQLIVQTWQGADEQGLYAKHAPIEAQRITIRGHDGYQFASTQRGANRPLEIEIWWTEAPGLVVSVRATDLFEVDELKALIEQMTPVDAAEYSTFIGAVVNP